MKTVAEYATYMLKVKDSPDALVDLKMELSGNLAFLLDTEYKPVKLEKADFWKRKDCFEDGTKREKPLSDTMVDALWKITPGGAKEIRLDITTKAYKTLIDAITTSVTWSQSSARMER